MRSTSKFNEELHYFLPVTCYCYGIEIKGVNMGQTYRSKWGDKTSYFTLVKDLLKKRSHRRSRRSSENDINMDLRERGYDNAKLIVICDGRVQRRTLLLKCDVCYQTI
jgi:hypothetical protein